jgi:hypothetical protein
MQLKSYRKLFSVQAKAAELLRALFGNVTTPGKISMVEIDRILAAAIRSVWLQVDGPGSPSPFRIEVGIARRVRIALEREGIMMTPSRQTPEVWQSSGHCWPDVPGD